MADQSGSPIDVAQGTCSIIQNGKPCPNPQKGRGMCRSHYMRWWRTGDPLSGKPTFASVLERFWSHVDRSGGPDSCWPWRDHCTAKGYVLFSVNGKLTPAHRWIYEQTVEPILNGDTIDHTCHTEDLTCFLGDACPHRRCMNVKHMEPVPWLVNYHRSRKFDKNECKRGHEWTEENTRWYTNPTTGKSQRYCRACERVREIAKMARQIADTAALGE